MAKKGQTKEDPVLETMRNLLIVQLAQAKLGVEDIRKVLGVAKERVNEVYRYLPSDLKRRKG